MAQKWDDDFDFEEIDVKKKVPLKKQTPNDDIFDFDMQDTKQKQHNQKSGNSLQPNNNKVINTKNQKNNKSNNQVDEMYKMGKNDKENKTTNKNNANNRFDSKDDEDIEQYYQEVFEENKIKNQKQQNIDQYANEQFDQENYEEDFQEPQDKKKSQKIANLSLKQNPKVILKPPSQKLNKIPIKAPVKQYSISKPPFHRNNSKKSLRSNADVRSVGHSTHITKSVIVHDKYKLLVAKEFPQNSHTEENQEKLIKQNDKIRRLIKRLNDQLNVLIDKNLQQLKAKKSQKSVGVQERIKILSEQKKNNQMAIGIMESQFDKLKGRQGQLKQEQYQLIIEKNINGVKQQIRQTQKQIVQLKFKVNNEGNKLSKKVEDKRITQQLANIKNNLIQVKKQDQKGTEQIRKLDEKIQELKSKLSDADYQLNEKISQAKEKGIQLQSKQELIAKHQTIKKKKDSLLQHIARTQALYKGKGDQVKRQNQQIRLSIQALQFDINKLYNNIVQKNSQSIQAIQTAKQNPKIMINASLAINLQEMKKELQRIQIQKDQIEQGKHQSRGHARPLKTPSSNKTEKKQQTITHNKAIINSVPIPPVDETNINKPNFMRKKKNDELIQLQKKNDLYERVWKEDQQKGEVKNQKQELFFEEKKEEDKKKPFSLKKNRMSQKNNQLDLNNDSTDKKDLKQQEEKSKQQNIPSIAPLKMMKFKKNKNQQNELKLQDKTNHPQKKLQQNKQPLKQQTPLDQALFIPKRLNLRKGGQKKQDSYIPTIQKKEQVFKKQEPNKIQQYKPNFNFKLEDNNISKKETPLIIQNNDNPITINQPQKEQKKPTFIKLRDRKKNQQNNFNEGGYEPTNFGRDDNSSQNQIKKQKIQNKIAQPIKIASNNQQANQKQYQLNNPYAPKKQTKNINNKKQQNINPPKEQINNPYNPYAKESSNVEIKKQRQGPLKKPKLNANQNKEKINIYDQVQDLTKANEFLNQVKVPINNSNQKNQQLNLNQMLGIKKNNKKDQDDDLFGAPKIQKKKEKKKNDDFFANIDL